MKIGILGGSFDPIHNGHLYMAQRSYEEYGLDEVWLMPAGHSPNKDERKMAAASDRLRMVQLAAEPYPYMKACPVETDSPERSYTCRTLEKLHEQYPQDVFYFIMGADSLDYFDHWYHPEVICRLAKILVINRDKFRLSDLNQKIRQIQALFEAEIQIVPCSKYDISSREIRSRIQKGEDCSGFLPVSVVNYIQEQHLYE